MNRLKKNKGFTLIELLVVIAIISLISSVVLASLNSARGKGRDAKRLSDLKQMELALEFYYDVNGIYPGVVGTIYYSLNANWTTLGSALNSFLPKLPIDPNNNDVTCFANGAHFYSYKLLNAGQGYGLYASLENPKVGATDPAGFPCCTTPNPGNCMYKATNGGVGIVR